MQGMLLKKKRWPPPVSLKSTVMYFPSTRVAIIKSGSWIQIRSAFIFHPSNKFYFTPASHQVKGGWKTSSPWTVIGRPLTSGKRGLSNKAKNLSCLIYWEHTNEITADIRYDTNSVTTETKNNLN